MQKVQCCLWYWLDSLKMASWILILVSVEDWNPIKRPWHHPGVISKSLWTKCKVPIFCTMDVHVLLSLSLIINISSLVYLQPNPEKLMNIFLLPVVAAPTPTTPQCSSLRRGFHRAALRLQDESKSDKTPSSSSTTYHEHYHAPPAEQDNAAASQDDSKCDPAAEQEASRPNTRLGNTKAHILTWVCHFESLYLSRPCRSFLCIVYCFLSTKKYPAAPCAVYHVWLCYAKADKTEGTS